MAKPHQRVFAFIAALLFLSTSVAVSALVVWQVHQQNQQEKASQELIKKATETKPASNSQPKPKEGQLQGTKLADFTPIDNVPELQKIDLQEGTGDTVKPGDTVTAHYTGAVAKDGVIFQSSHDGPNQPVPFGLDQVIKGWTEGVPGMKVGGKRRLVIPYAQAYGDEGRPSGGIPAKADLVFDIELVKIGK